MTMMEIRWRYMSDKQRNFLTHTLYIISISCCMSRHLSYNAGMRLRCGLSVKNYIARHCSVQFSHDNILAAYILRHLFFFLMYKCSTIFGAMKHMLLRICSIATILKSQLLTLMDRLIPKHKKWWSSIFYVISLLQKAQQYSCSICEMQYL